jgi:hypothetical protein
MILDFLLMALFGFGLHQTRNITAEMPNGWQNISEHSVGGAGLLVAWPYWYKRMYTLPEGFIRGWLALAMALLSVGAGVVAGWYLDK